MRKLVFLFLPKRFDAITLFGKIYTRHGISATLYAHELVHVEQQRLEPIMFYFWYVFDKEKRAEYEAEAYAASVKHGLRLDIAAMNLAFDYGLELMVTDARKMIEKYL